MKHVENIPSIKNVDDLKKYLNPIYIIEPYMETYDIYTEFFESLYDIIKGCYEIKECREYPVEIKFYENDKITHVMQFRHFIVNLILWYPFVSVYGIKFMNEEIIMDGTKIMEEPQYELNTFINDRIIKVLRFYNVKEKVINETLSNLNHNLCRISIDFSDIMNLNFSFFTIYEKFKNNPRLREVMECEFPDKSEPREIELQIDSNLNELINIYKSDRSDSIGTILRSGTGFKDKQLGEFMISVGYTPTIDGRVISIPVENSMMIGGLDRPSYFYIGATAARKSLIMNKSVMGKAGNFGKLVLQLARTLTLSKTVTDCDTKHFVEIEIKNKTYLNKLNGRFYKIGEDDEFRPLNPKTDTDLIGKTITMRSPTTCALGNCVCQKCYGLAAANNYELADGLSAFESEEITKELEQNILSAKHLLTTKSEVLTFNDAFYKYFTLNAGAIYPNFIDNEYLDDISNFAIWIDPSSIERISDSDVDSSYNTYISTGTFYVENLSNGEKEIISIDQEKPMFLSDNFIDIWRSKKKKDNRVYFCELDDLEPIIEMSILNDELTKPLYNMMKLFNNSKYIPTDISEAVQKFIDILIESRIAASSVAGECIMNRLIRSKIHIYDRPDFTKEDLEPYAIRTVADCLKRNGSPTLGLATQYLKMQMVNPEITKRHKTSYVDAFMKIKVPNLYELYHH